MTHFSPQLSALGSRPSTLRIALKGTALFVAFNLLWLIVQPMPALGSLSVYGWLVPHRERLPYGENPAANNLSTNSLEAMFATHAIRAPKAADEFRVVVIGDSATWGILLTPAETLTSQLNTRSLMAPDGRRMRFYNLAHPIMSLTKDLLLLDIARAYNPDGVIWLNTLESFYRPEQLRPPLLQANAARVRDLAARFDLALDVDSLPAPTWWEQTFIGQRRLAADWWRLQWFGFAWATTGIDQIYPEFTPRRSDFAVDFSWKAFPQPDDLTPALAFEVIAAAHAMLGDVPLLLVNQPIFVSSGQNSDIRYNTWYPRWAFDQFRLTYADQAAASGWRLIDLWDVVAPERFTDSPVHLDALGVQTLADALALETSQLANGGSS
jgi:lysophospholipase L1-like esterase